MVDSERLHRILREVTSRLVTLRGYATVAEGGDSRAALLADEVRLGHLKWTFQGALEAAIDAAHHVLAVSGGRVPATNADAFVALAEVDWISRPLAARLADAARFRNVLVHRYADVDDLLVVDHLRQLDALDEFVRALTARMRDGGD